MLPIIITSFVYYRFVTNMLSPRFPRIPTLILVSAWYSLESYINIHFFLYQRFDQRIFYLFCNMLLLILAFHGSAAKKLLTAILLDAIGYTACFIFLPALDWYANFLSKDASHLPYALCDVLSLFTTFLILELIRRKFKYLHGTMSAGCCFYLLGLSLFISWSVCTYGDLRIYISRENIGAAFGSTLFALAGMFLIILTIHYVEQRLNQLLMSQQLTMEKQHIRALEDMESSVAQVRHDTKNHLICLKNLLEKSCYAEASVYLDKLTGCVNALTNTAETGNRFADAILKEKAAVAKEHGIKLSLDMVFPPEDVLPSVLELTAILSNAFDNALEACLRSPGAAQANGIQASSFVRGSRLFIELINPSPSHDHAAHCWKTWKSDPAAHGIGLRNIRSAVERLDGTMELSEKGGIVSLCIMLPLNQTAGAQNIGMYELRPGKNTDCDAI